MVVFPEGADLKLGFGVIENSLKSRLVTPMGEELWGQATCSTDVSFIRSSLSQVGEMQDLLRYDDPFPLTSVADVRDLVKRAQPEGGIVSIDGLLELNRVLGTSRRCKRYLLVRKDKYESLRGPGNDLVEARFLEQRIEQTVDPQGFILDSASPGLHRIRKDLARAHLNLRTQMLRELRKASDLGYAAEDQPTIRNGRMVIPIRAEAKRKVSGFIHDHSSTGQTAYIEPTACLDLNNEIRSLEHAEEREIEAILRELANEIRSEATSIKAAVAALGQLDLVVAKAKLSNELDAEIPSINEDGIFSVNNARNPALALRYRREKREVVPLSLTMGEDYRTLVITGPNAGGKSVTLKTVGLLARMVGFGIPLPLDGKNSSVCLFDKLFVDIGDEQSVENDLSTFSSHLLNLRYILERSDSQTLVLIDEAGTGTDPVEGAALAQAMMEQLTLSGALTVVTTHHGGLKVYAHEASAVKNAAMQFDEVNLSPTYVLQVGVPGASYAFEIARRLETPDSLLVRAKELVGSRQNKFEDLILAFEAKNQELRERLAAIVSEQDALQKAKSDYERRRDQIRENRETLRQEALAEAAEILRSANAQVERTVREIRESGARKEDTQAARRDLEQFKQSIEKRKSGIEKRREKKKGQQRSVESTVRPRVGDQVRVRDGKSTADLVEIRGKNAIIVQGSMKLQVRYDQLQRVGGRRKQEITVKTSASTSSIPAYIKMRIDVRGKRVDEAISEVTRFVDDAVVARLERLEILHGTGTGALRIALREWLSAHEAVVSTEDAPWDQGGPGVTIISLA